MAFMAWDDSYSIAVKIFDDEHKRLIAIANELYDACNRDAEQSALERIYDRLLEHVVMHFRHEEMYFDDWQYPDRVEHTAAHRRLRRQLFEFRSAFLTPPEPEKAEELFAVLKNWLSQHILTDDRKYGAFLLGRGLR